LLGRVFIEGTVPNSNEDEIRNINPLKARILEFEGFV
jgi:hypothetical protein